MFGKFNKNGNNLKISSEIQDGDIILDENEAHRFVEGRDVKVFTQYLSILNSVAIHTDTLAIGTMPLPLIPENSDVYNTKKWDLNRLSEKSFREWYDGEGHRNLFTEGKFKHSKGSQYHSLVKRYNVFIEFLNRRTRDYDKDMQLCEDIMKKYQKERFDQIKRDDLVMLIGTGAGLSAACSIFRY